jgi:hypothetical protein
MSIRRTTNDILRCLTGSIGVAEYLHGVKKTSDFLFRVIKIFKDNRAETDAHPSGKVRMYT